MKTGAAIRDLPIHPRLLELGFADYIAALRATGRADRVLEGVKLGRRKAVDPAGKWFQRYKEAHLAGFKETGKVLHSTRHTFYKTAVNEADIPTTFLKQMMGHSQEKELGAGTSYNKGARARKLLEEISKVRYECSAVDALGQDWERLNLFR